MKMKVCRLLCVFAALISCLSVSAHAQQNWMSSFEEMSRALAPGSVWSGDVTFVTVSPECKSLTAFKVGDVRKASYRPHPIGRFAAAAMIIFPDGLWLGVAKSARRYGSIGINKSVWLFASPTDDNRYSITTNPAFLTTLTPKAEIEAVFTYFYAVPGCTVRVKGTLFKT